MGDQLLVQFLASLLTGGGTYVVAKWLFDYVESYTVGLSPQTKRLVTLPVCLAIAMLAVGGEVALGVAQFTAENVFIALTAGFTASQMFHVPDLSNVRGE